MIPAGVGSVRPVTPLGIAVGRLQSVCERLERATDAPAELVEELRSAISLAAGLDPYVERCTTPESSALSALAERTRSHVWTDGLEAEMLSGHVEGQLLKMLVHANGARRVLEIGMFTGYAALAMAEALPDDGRVVTCEIDPEAAAIAREAFDRSAAGDRIEIRVGAARDTLAQSARDDEQFDFVFIDADKSGYVDYLALILERGLLAPGALVAVDNTLMQGEPYAAGRRSANGDAIAQFNEVVAADPRVEQVLVPIRDGLTLIRRVDR